MGIDTLIYVKTKDGKEPNLCDPLPDGCSIVQADEDYASDGATHEISQPWRYYGPGYERGSWPRIAATLLALHAADNVDAVWYFGDCHEWDAPFTPDRVIEYSRHYMEHGDRPYRRPKVPNAR